ncbi:hypothetical protein RYX36_031067, partial [Vicia faba]
MKIFGDPDAADVVFTSGADILAVGINVTHQVVLSGRTITRISICGKRNSPSLLKNARGYTLKCSHYLPSPFPEDTSLPCVVYCHGNSGCRADANEAAVILLPSNITVFTLDFSGSGLSDGDYVSLGWHEVKMAVQYMRRVIEKKAKFDIMKLNCVLVAPKTFIPVLFGHASDDKFIQPHHSDLISESYAGDKNIIKFDGDHNSSRPQFFYDSVSIFFYNVLRPPQVSIAEKLEKYYDLGDLKLGSGVDEVFSVSTPLRSAPTDAASSSSAFPTISETNSVTELLSEAAPLADAPLFEEDTRDKNDEAANVQ